MNALASVRGARQGDVSACLQASASRKDSFFTERDFTNALDDGDAIYLVAEENGKVVEFILGYVNPTKNEEAMIQSTMVHADYGCKGIGSLLVRALADSAFGRGVMRVFAEAEDGPDKFYEKCRFRRVYEWHSMQLSKKGLG
jgi:N-acetylglutamate synthase-like GNAT family acetyltransferase